MSHKFDPKKLAKLNNPERVKLQDPDVMWEKLDCEIQDCLVDIGAGTGFYSQLFLNKMATGMVYALDISDEMLAWTTENLPGVKAARVQPMKMQESETPLSDSLADAVVMLNLHHELHDPSALMAECFRILKPRGKVLISDWKACDGEMGPPQEIRKSAVQIQQDLEQAGFRGVQSFESFSQHSVVIAQKPE